MNNETTRSVNFVLTLLTVIHGSIASIMSAIILLIIIYHQHNNRMKQEDKITLILCVNIYLYIFLCSTILILLNIQTLLGDLYGLNFDSTSCVFLGYLNAVLICALYYGFFGQALYRFCRIVYPKHKWLQAYWLYIIEIPSQFISACLIMCPLYVWHDITYIPDLYQCFVPNHNIVGTIWIIVFLYGLPVFSLSIIYIHITIHIRQQSSNQTIAVKRRQARDFVVIRRIIILNSILFILVVPGMIMLVINYITGNELTLNYRVTWFSFELSMILLSILMIFMIPQLKVIVLSKWKRNRVIPIAAIVENSVQIRTAGTLQ
ncbi:unnamed protein product [Adineta steineri]|uniref:G-protein coupled receptors family 1 profile domain-containing protein n=1 Tax=Adineta steineri TaxID=433720 RepID=A0A814RIX6_9BILA|nr:unnamed protein product [Adineta steineri]CAF1230618.1 unnamed protein product [Adineta steineri]CAF3816730.1 unnamed protein product [Adineta steineri]CAF4050669.1 unnamed protein product [Adineta steineri]